MRYLYEDEIHYRRHPLKRLITVTGFLSADYVEGSYRASDPHSHQDAWELGYCVSGHLCVSRNDGTHTLKASQFSLIPPGTVHDYDAPGSDSRFFVLCFTLSGEENLMPFQDVIFQADGFQKELFYRMTVEVCNAYEHDPRLEERIKVLDFQPSKKDPLGGEQLIALSLETILICACRNMTRQGDEIVRTEGFRKAVQDYLIHSVQTYIHENATIRMTVKDVAGHFNYSRTYFSSFYKEAAGQTLKNAITQSVLEKAKRSLSNKTLSIGETAAALDFDSVQYFSHWFKRNTGMTPTDFLKGQQGGL